MNIPPPPPPTPSQVAQQMHSQQAQKFLRELLMLNATEREEMRRTVGLQQDYLRATGQLI